MSMGIYDVSLNGKTHKSWSSFHDGGYANRVGSVPRITLVGNTAYSMSVQVGVGNPSNNELVNVYIDYNNNGSFSDSAEEIYVTAGGSGKKNGESFTFSFTTPAAPISQGLRMRIISDFDSGAPLTATHTPGDGGQIEDYTVELSMALPVEFVNFGAKPFRNNILLDWEVASQLNNEAFVIERKNSTDNEFLSIGRVEGEGSSSEYSKYSYIDQNVEPGVMYYYRLKQIDFDGNFDYSEIRSAKIEDNARTQISVFPNPANDKVTIEYRGETTSAVELGLFSITGQMVLSEKINIGDSHKVELNIDFLENGIYLLQSKVDGEIITKKLIIGI